jgi:hypothetical protein
LYASPGKLAFQCYVPATEGVQLVEYVAIPLPFTEPLPLTPVDVVQVLL